MGLRLIYSSNEKKAEAPVSAPMPESRLVWAAVGLFLLFKIPMLFVTNNPEELRDFDHFLRMASGQTAYRDFVWLYGPLAPLFYGTFLKLLPEKLLMVRVLTLGVWCAGVAWLAQLLQRYNFKGFSFWFGVVFLTGLIGYPSYSHNHILPAVALIGVVYYLSRFYEKNDEWDLHYSYFCALTVLFCRPVLMGYGVMGLWGALFLVESRVANKTRLVSFYGLALVTGLLIFRFIYGAGLWSAFFPQPWAILETKSYPNLHYLVPHPHFLEKEGLVLFLKQVRASLETGTFYLHYFIWPTLVLTLANLVKGRLEIKTAALAAGFALVASLDLLHYGFSDPLSEQAMWVRGQYFFTGTALSLFLVLWPTLSLGRTFWVKATSFALLAVITFWSYLPWLTGTIHLFKYPKNQFRLPAMMGISTHADRSAIFEAVAFVNSKALPNDSVVFPQYEPGMARLLTARDLFEKDSYMFTRAPWYVLNANETPYAPSGKVTNGQVIESRLVSEQPRFFVIQGKSIYRAYCEKPGWHSKDFGAPGSDRTVCWRE